MKEAKFTINADGTMSLETSGYKGKACEDAINKLIASMREDGVDIDVKDMKKKPEYYAAESSAEIGRRV